MKKGIYILAILLALSSCGTTKKVVNLTVVDTKSYSGTLKYRIGPINYGESEDNYISPQLIKLLKDSIKPKIVFRIPNDATKTLQNERSSELIKSFEKEFMKKGFVVKDRNLLNLCLTSNSGYDFKKIQETMDVDIIIEILDFDFDSGFETGVKAYDNNTFVPFPYDGKFKFSGIYWGSEVESYFGKFPFPEVEKQGIYDDGKYNVVIDKNTCDEYYSNTNVECKFILVNNGQIGGVIKKSIYGVYANSLMPRYKDRKQNFDYKIVVKKYNRNIEKQYSPIEKIIPKQHSYVENTNVSISLECNPKQISGSTGFSYTRITKAYVHLLTSGYFFNK